MNRQKRGLALEKYRELVRLDEPFLPSCGIMLNEREAVVDRLLAILQDDMQLEPYAEKRQALQALLTVRAPEPFLPEAFHVLMDGLLQSELAERPLTLSQTLPSIAVEFPNTSYAAADRCALWQGDITSLQVDAIVNAANTQMLGCFIPFHNCIDNVIQMAAGSRVREDCHRIMQKQGHEEGTGWAKVTRAHNLPAKFIMHTVGPIVARGQAVTGQERQMLAQAYRSVLDLSAEMNLSSIAFCCISTGVFGFPKAPASQIALDTVAEWLATHDGSVKRVVFNVFTGDDLSIYQKKLG